MEKNKKRDTIIGVIAILIILLAGGFACKYLIDTTNEAYSYDINDKWEGFAEEIDKQTKEYEKRAEEAKEIRVYREGVTDMLLFLPLLQHL